MVVLQIWGTTSRLKQPWITEEVRLAEKHVRSVRLSQRTRCPGTRFGGPSSSSQRDRTVGGWVSASQLLALQTRDNAADNTTRPPWPAARGTAFPGRAAQGRLCHVAATGQSVATSAKALLLPCNKEPWRKASFASWAGRERTAKSRPIKYAPDPAVARCPFIKICDSPTSALRQEGRDWTDRPSILLGSRSFPPACPCASLSFCASALLEYQLLPPFFSQSSLPATPHPSGEHSYLQAQSLISSPAPSKRPLSQPQL